MEALTAGFWGVVGGTGLFVGVKPSESARMTCLLITGDNRGVAGVCTGHASPGLLSRFLFSALPCVAPYCVRGGVRVVSSGVKMSPLYPYNTVVYA